MTEGKFDIAANFLRLFVDSNPSDAELVELENKYGPTVFEALRTVKWSDDKAFNDKARATVEELLKRSRAANQKLLNDPARIAKYIRNLGATREERLYAMSELRRSGDYAVPMMVDELRITRDNGIYSGLLEAIEHLEDHAVAGFVAALDGLTEDQQFGVVTKIFARPDALNLQTIAQTDLTPYFWRVLANPKANPMLRRLAEDALIALRIKPDTKVPEAELTKLARTYYDGTAHFGYTINNPDGTPRSAPLWVWDAKASKLIKLDDLPIDKAREYFGLRYARWVLDARPSDAAAQGLMLALAAEKAIERANYGSLATTEPAAYKLLADAPSAVLIEQLQRGVNQKRTSLVLAMLQVLGDRGDREVATPPAGPGDRPSLLVRAITEIADPRVQFAAANALLRSGLPISGAVKARIVDILRSAAASDASVPETSKGTALLADPSATRAASVSLLLRGLGYQVEVVKTGRDLLRRIARASDFDVIVIDRHIPNPELIDLVGQIQSDVKGASRPILVVASPDTERRPTFDQLLVRFAALIASTENEKSELEYNERLHPYAPNPRDRETSEEITKRRKENGEQRDKIIERLAKTRLDRLNRIIDASGVQLTSSQKLLLSLRADLLTYAVLKLQYPYSEENAPDTIRHLNKFRAQLREQPAIQPYGAGFPTADLIKLLERFEIDLAKVPERRKEFESLYSRIDPSEFGMPIETFRDPVAEARLSRQLRNYPTVKIIPEPFGPVELASDLLASYQDSAQAPRNPIEKKTTQKAAVEWLRQMATGDLPGFDVKPAEAELRAALRVDDLAEAAIDAVARMPSAGAQEDLLTVVLNRMRPLPIRSKAADGVIRNIQANGKSIPKTLFPAIAETSGAETDLALRGKLLTIKGLLAFEPGAFVNDLKSYSPPLVPPPAKPAAPPAKEPVKD
jgi:CheY-like chemotaxis protein